MFAVSNVETSFLKFKTQPKQKKSNLNLICVKWVPRDPNTIFSTRGFTRKTLKNISISIFALEIIRGSISYSSSIVTGVNIKKRINMQLFGARLFKTLLHMPVCLFFLKKSSFVVLIELFFYRSSGTRYIQ